MLRAYAADVYGHGESVEARLIELFELAARWNGILLLDEADVYMQNRAVHGLDQNQLVSSKSFVGFLLGPAANDAW